MPRIDEFYYKQPPLSFVEELKSPYYSEISPTFGTRKISEGEVDVFGVYLKTEFPDPEGLLETVYFEFNRFSKLFKISGNRYPIIIKKGIVHGYESYSIAAETEKCVICAEDTEGIRRALIYVMDELVSREGAFLPTERIERYPIIKTRITRGFFSPTNRPPKNIDELMDDVDYYPDEYLNRLSHDGTNGIWIYTRFSGLMASPYIPEYGEDRERRVAKLGRVINKCKRYGIKVYIFAIEPNYLTPQLAKSHPEILGADPIANQYYPICPSTKEGAEYIIDSTERIFRELPELGGFIGITFGERMSSCVASPTFHTCPRCSKKSRGKALGDVVNLLREGMRRAGTGAEMISWTYGHRTWEHEDIREYVRTADNDIALMQNFEDMGYPTQLGKERIAVDYWLSYVGPSPMFEATADEARKTGKTIYAKMQVCCSHELATVPYIPAPGIIYDKYKEAISRGVTGIVGCWYFGNYPSLMSKAAGELSFADERLLSKDEFLFELSAKLYGKSRAESVVRAFELFEKGYKNYPVNVMFSYYGPIHDGVVWKLQLKPKDICLPRSWQLLDPPDGDRINECLWYGHTLDEAVTLTELMSKYWKEGMAHLDKVSENELFTLASAIEVLFDSGNNILRFYQLRDRLGENCDASADVLSEMESIVMSEIENSERMIALCNNDSRLGYHSEAEGFKFFPEKLLDRIEYLKNLLNTEFSDVKARIACGLVPLEYYSGKKDGKIFDGACIIKKKNSEKPNVFCLDNTESNITLSYDDKNIYVTLDGKSGTEYFLFFEYKLGYPDPSIVIKDGNMDFTIECRSHQSVFGDKADSMLEKYTLTVAQNGERTTNHLTVSRDMAGWTENKPFRLRFGVRNPGDVDFVFWQSEDELISHLGKNYSDPRAFKWIIPQFNTL